MPSGTCNPHHHLAYYPNPSDVLYDRSSSIPAGWRGLAPLYVDFTLPSTESNRRLQNPLGDGRPLPPLHSLCKILRKRDASLSDIPLMTASLPRVAHSPCLLKINARLMGSHGTVVRLSVLQVSFLSTRGVISMATVPEMIE